MLSPLPTDDGHPPESGVASYAAALMRSMRREPGFQLSVLAQKHAVQNDVGPASVDRVWTPTVVIPFQVNRALKRIAPDVLHVQHEFNLYGGVLQGLLLTLTVKAHRRRGVGTMT